MNYCSLCTGMRQNRKTPGHRLVHRGFSLRLFSPTHHPDPSAEKPEEHGETTPDKREGSGKTYIHHPVVPLMH